MRFNKYELKEKEDFLLGLPNMAAAERIIFQWVKDDKLSPAAMSHLILLCSRYFNGF